jgi:hypothetical protein
MIAPYLKSLDELRRSPLKEKRSRIWQDMLWQHWPTPAQWPGTLDVFEAAAYKRLSEDTIRAAARPGRDRRAKLRHQRFGATYRFAKADLDTYGLVQAREVAS